MAQRASMKVCPNCHAPNPMQYIVCFSCGGVLDNPVAAVPAQSDTLHRSDDIALSPGSPPRTVSATVPGWAIETLPDASIRLRRGGWRHFRNRFKAPICCLLCGLAFWVVSVSHQHDGLSPSWFAGWRLVSFSFFALTVPFALWEFGAREEIRAGHGFFVRTMSLGPIVCRWRFDHLAEIYVYTAQASDKTGDYTYRRLLIRESGKKLILDRLKRLDSVISIGMHAPIVEDEISTMGRFLSEVTGWPFIDQAICRR